MSVVSIEPTRGHRIPYDVSDDSTGSFLEEMAVAGNTAEAQQVLGAALGVNPDLSFVEEHSKKFTEAMKSRDPRALHNPAVALSTAAFLRTYGSQLALDAVSMRIALTNKLVEIADCGDTKYELKALELLGRHSDIGLFTERSEVTINYKSPDELEKAIKERVQRVLNANIIDVTPTHKKPDIFDEPAETPRKIIKRVVRHVKKPEENS